MDVEPLNENLKSSPFVHMWTDAVDFESNDVEGAPQFRVLTFNILADALARGSDETSEIAKPCPAIFEEEGAGGVAYDGSKIDGAEHFKFSCSADALTWARRWPMLKSLILDLEPDVIGLQEVDLLADGPEKLNAHDKEIRRDFADAGYVGTFARKLGRACDGVALFWRHSRLRQAGRTETWRLGNSVHVALAQPLCLDGTWRFTAVATHLKAGLTQSAEDVRTKQTNVLLERLKNHSNAVLLADLNTHCRPLISNAGSVERLEEDTLAEQSGAYPLLMEHLQSAFKCVLGDEPSFTCWGGWTDREVRLVCDYILFKGNLLKPRRILNVPSAAEVLAYPERLPNLAYPSDHFPLAADLVVVQNGLTHPSPTIQRLTSPCLPQPPQKRIKY